jgi:hypothetical protein
MVGHFVRFRYEVKHKVRRRFGTASRAGDAHHEAKIARGDQSDGFGQTLTPTGEEAIWFRHA